MVGGELFVPKIPSYKIMDVYRAIAPECDYELVGIRPGEKLHEEMITKSDAINAIEFNDYFIILPSIQMWKNKNSMKIKDGEVGKKCKEDFSYDSLNNPDYLTVDQLKKIIDENIKS